MAITFKKYSSAKLRNNCPECYSADGLELNFFNKTEENTLYSSASNEVKSNLYCSVCNQNIYPERWTEDIERVYEYNRKLAGSPETYLRLKPLSIFIIIALGVAAGVIVYFMK